MVTRIRELLDSKELSPTQFADLIGVGRPVMSHILSERNKPSLEVVQRIIGAFPEISLAWLLSGTGDMLEGVAPSPIVASESAAAATPVAEAMPAARPATPAVATPPAMAPAFNPPASPVEVPPVAPAGPAVAATSMVAPIAASMAPASTPAPVAKPAKVSRFVPKGSTTGAPVASAPTPSPQPQPPQPPPLSVVDAAVGIAEVSPPTLTTAAALAATLPPPSSPATAPLLPFLPEPGKAIRRIVIFYRDGSFADYQPES